MMGTRALRVDYDLAARVCAYTIRSSLVHRIIFWFGAVDATISHLIHTVSTRSNTYIYAMLI